ncbi:hypothetical protein DFP73DRAFT_264338 [Morchella snyderi]|nr:hypothetical protein DFP73DRAFT_264338 [Morchella snyderi]
MWGLGSFFFFLFSFLLSLSSYLHMSYLSTNWFEHEIFLSTYLHCIPASERAAAQDDERVMPHLRAYHHYILYLSSKQTNSSLPSVPVIDSCWSIVFLEKSATWTMCVVDRGSESAQNKKQNKHESTFLQGVWRSVLWLAGVSRHGASLDSAGSGIPRIHLGVLRCMDVDTCM